MGTQVNGRKRIPNREKLTAEDDALNQIAREAEARLAAKRAARAEAREIRMKELERQQKEIYQSQKRYTGLDSKWGHIEQWMEDSERYSRPSRRHTSMSDDEERMSVGSRGSLRGVYSCSTSSLPTLQHRHHHSSHNGRPSDYSGFLGSSSRASSRASSARASPVVEERTDRDFVDKGSRTASTLSAATLASLGGPLSRRGSCDTSFSVETEASIRDIKDSLCESEEKYRKAMVSNAQLHNEKSNLMYQVDTLKETLVELEEALWESRRELSDRSKELEREKHAYGVLQFQFGEMKETLRQSEELLNKHGIVVTPEVTTNGDAGQAEIDGHISSDSATRLAYEPHTGGESMLGGASEKQCGRRPSRAPPKNRELAGEEETVSHVRRKDGQLEEAESPDDVTSCVRSSAFHAGEPQRVRPQGRRGVAEDASSTSSELELLTEENSPETDLEGVPIEEPSPTTSCLTLDQPPRDWSALERRVQTLDQPPGDWSALERRVQTLVKQFLACSPGHSQISSGMLSGITDSIRDRMCDPEEVVKSQEFSPTEQTGAVRRLKSQLEQKQSNGTEGVCSEEDGLENGLDPNILDLQRDANRQISDLKFKLVKSEQEVTALEQNVLRLEGQVTRYKSASESSEKVEDELKVEKRKLQRELRSALDRIDELEASNNHLSKRLEKMKANRSALLAQQ
ncbi:leucine-rich repeat flightless-interacting protein 2 [Aplochiton taeniatus]